MILGSGNAQINLIKAAQELEYETVVCDSRPDQRGSKLADKYYSVDYMDRAAILDIAQSEGIDGVVSNAEPAMLNVAYLCEQLNLPGNSVESIETLISKTKFRELQKKEGVFAPKFAVAASEEELLAVIKDMEYPIIIKPCESSGTRGTTKLIEYDEPIARSSFKICQEFSRNNLVTVEEYVEAKSLAFRECDLFVIGQDILWDGWFWAYRSKHCPMLPMASAFPLTLSQKDICIMQEIVKKLLHTAGIQLGEYNVEIYDTKDNEIFVIEINPRQGGNYIPQLIEEHTGVSFTKLLVSTAVGDMRYFQFLKTFQRKNCYITRQSVFSQTNGTFKSLYIDPSISKYVKWIDMCVSENDPVFAVRNAADAVAYVDLEFDNLDVQSKFTSEIEHYIYPILK